MEWLFSVYARVSLVIGRVSLTCQQSPFAVVSELPIRRLKRAHRLRCVQTRRRASNGRTLVPYRERLWKQLLRERAPSEKSAVCAASTRNRVSVSLQASRFQRVS